jgi:hypothetical protein
MNSGLLEAIFYFLVLALPSGAMYFACRSMNKPKKIDIIEIDNSQPTSDPEEDEDYEEEGT